MLDLTPLEVRRKREDFGRELRGYDRGEVDSFLELVAERLEQLVRQNAQLQERVGELGEAVEAFRGREQAMNSALITAQQLREEIRSQSERQAELVLRESRAEGERLLAEARQRSAHERGELERLRSERDRFLRHYRSFLEAQLEEISLEEERGVRIRTGELDPESGAPFADG